MKSVKTFLIAFLALCSSVMTAADFMRNGNYITIPVKNPFLQGAKMLRLQVVGDKIIRVQATNGATFAPKQSLIIVPQTAVPTFKVTAQAGKVVVSTRLLKVVVDAKTWHFILLKESCYCQKVKKVERPLFLIQFPLVRLGQTAI